MASFPSAGIKVRDLRPDTAAKRLSRLCIQIESIPRASARAQLTADLGGVSLEFGVAVETEQDGAHLVALGEDNLVEIAVLELVEEAVQFSHRFANRRELGVGDSNTLGKVSHRSRR
jgi:hypothetical protein